MKNDIRTQYNVYGKHPAYLYEDKQCIVFEEKVNPQVPIHFLVMPKKSISNSTSSIDDKKILGHLLILANKIALEKGLQITGYHIMIDQDFGSSRFKGVHVFGRTWHHMTWPIAPGSRL